MAPPHATRRWIDVRTVVASAATGGLYYALGRFGLRYAYVEDPVSIFWPPSGIALAATILFGARVWPGIAVAALLVQLKAGTPTAAAATIAVGNTLEAVIGAILLRRAIDFDPALERLKDAMGLAVFGAEIAPAIAATI